jgi:hypothetical protein
MKPIVSNQQMLAYFQNEKEIGGKDLDLTGLRRLSSEHSLEEGFPGLGN